MSEFKNVTDFTNFLPYRDLNIIRAYRVAFPVINVKVDILREAPAKSFHMVEKYMDQLIAGYSKKSPDFCDRVIIDSKQQLFELLGIDGEAYDISSLFYNDLLQNGHFEETPEGLKPLDRGKDSLKLQKKLITSSDTAIVTVNPFTMEVLSGELGSVKTRTSESLCNSYDKHILFLDPPDYIADAVALETAMNSVKYDAIGLADRKLPHDFKRFSIAEGESQFCDVRYLVFFLTISENDGVKQYSLYDIETASLISDVNLNDSNYDSLKNTVTAISQREITNKGFGHKISNNLFIKIKHNHGVYNGIMVTDSGNYIATVTDKMLYDMLHCEKEKFSLRPFHYFANDNAVVLDYFESGRLLTFSATDEQIEFVRKIIENNPEIDPIIEEYFKDKTISCEPEISEDESNRSDELEIETHADAEETTIKVASKVTAETQKPKSSPKPKKKSHHYDDDDGFWEDDPRDIEYEKKRAKEREYLEKRIETLEKRIRSYKFSLSLASSSARAEIEDTIRDEEFELREIKRELKFL